MKKKKTVSKQKVSAKTELPPSTLKFNCITFNQGRHELVLFIAEAKTIWDIAEVNQLETDKEDGYQRAASSSRTTQIAKFIDADNAIPLSVLIAFDNAQLNRHKTTLSIPQKPDAGWIIDGQHRLAGAYKAKNDILIPVIALLNAPVVDQIQFFVTINREQRGVPSSLYYELLKQLPGEKSEKDLTSERAADLADALRRDESSPFFNRIVSVTSPKKGQLSLTNFVRKTSPLLKRDGRLFMYTDEERQSIINNYFCALEHIYPSEFKKTDSIFFKTVGFGAMMNALPVFLTTTIESQGGFQVQDIISVFKKIQPTVDPSRWNQLGSGNAAELQAAQDIIVELQAARETSTLTGRLKL